MSSGKIWLSPPHMSGNEIKYVQEAFQDNWIAPVGPDISLFEENLENYLHDGKHVAVLSSGTAAIHLALILMGVATNDEVICQSFTFAATANPITYLNARPVFVDSEPDSWNICPDALETAIKDRIKKGKTPKAIIAVHLYGMPYKVNDVHLVARKYGIPVLEDSAEALGSSYAGKKCGTFGDFAILSFNGNKIITTSGGGAIVANSSDLKQRAMYLATQAKHNLPYYHHTETGYNYRLSNVSAAIGRGQMEILSDFVSLRRETNCFYNKIFANFEGIKLQTEYAKDVCSNFWLTACVFDQTSTLKNTDLINLLAKDDIESRMLWKPLHLQPVFKGAAFYGTNVAESYFNNGICLPSGSSLTKHDKERIAAIIQAFLNSTE